MDILPAFIAREDGMYELAFDWKIEVSFGVVEVKRGFVTDGASVPRMAWLFAGHPMESPRVYAALVHDWLYCAHVCDRRTADLIYKEVLERYRAKWRVWIEWKALDLFGQAAWDSHGVGDQDFARRHGAFERINTKKEQDK